MKINYNDTIKHREFIIAQAVIGKITNKQAMKELQMSERQISRMRREYIETGGLSLHGNTGNKHHQTNFDETCNKILELRNTDLYKDTNFNYFKECLLEDKGIRVSYSFLYDFLARNGIKPPKYHRRRVLHKTRQRRESFGELLQGDASKHQWFYKLGDMNYYNLHGFIDDATSSPVALYMTTNECFTGYAEALRITLEENGIPDSLYVDGARIFFNNDKRNLSIEEQLGGKDAKLTQFGEICKNLGVNLIYAKSSQAKGRVERMWGTMQNRLPVEFAKREINNIGDANVFLQEYKHIYTSKFAIEPICNKSMFLPFNNNINLDEFLACKFTRSLDKGATFSLNNITFRVEDYLPHLSKRVIVLISETVGVKVKIDGKLYDVTPLIDRKIPIPSSKSSVESIIQRFVYQNCLKDEHRVE